jgi:hypothetical protein
MTFFPLFKKPSLSETTKQAGQMLFLYFYVPGNTDTQVGGHGSLEPGIPASNLAFFPLYHTSSQMRDLCVHRLRSELVLMVRILTML